MHPLSSATSVTVKLTHELRTLAAEMDAMYAHPNSYYAAKNHNHKQLGPTLDLIIEISLRRSPSILSPWPWKGNLLQLELTCISSMDLLFLVPHPELLSDISKDVLATAMGLHIPLPQTKVITL